MRNCSFFVLLAVILASCQVQHQPAPIVYNHTKSDSANSNSEIISNDDDWMESIYDNLKNDDYIAPQPKAESNYKIIYHEVEVGETIEEIALQYEQTVEEIARLNALFPPYYLDEFQILKIRVKKIKEKNLDKEIEQLIDTDSTPAVKKTVQTSFIKPVKGKIITKFGESAPYGISKGINIAAKEGTKIVASASGKVIYADYDATFGYLVIIKVDGKNIVTSYAHMEDLIISKGKSVTQGDIIGYVGNTGKVDKHQLHFSIREGKKAKDPMKFIKN